MESNWDEYRNKIIGLGENSFKKSYYPDLQSKIEELEATKSNLETIFNSTSDAIIIHDIEGNIINMNTQALSLYNLKRYEISNYTIFDISSDKNDKSKLSNIWQRVSKHGNLTFEWVALQKETGKEVDVQVSINKTIYNQKEVMVSVIRDFTDRKDYEHKLIKALEKAEESDKLKTAFLQNISHEIRTPLNAISGFTDLLSDPNLSPQTQSEYIKIIQNSSSRLTSIISDIITISALETNQEELRYSNVCINSIIGELNAVFEQQASQKGLILYSKRVLNEEQANVLTDRTKVTQILSNLISNSIKFTNEGFVEFGCVLKGNSLEFFVKDSGIGIEPEFHEKIFERFRQADRSINRLYGGTGLGLAISKAFLDLLGGKIWLNSEPNKGSVFYFTIPYKRAK